MVLMQGETISSGAANPCSECGVEMKLRVLESGAGYYIGTWCNCGPYSRESGYYRSFGEAANALAAKDFSRG